MRRLYAIMASVATLVVMVAAAPAAASASPAPSGAAASAGATVAVAADREGRAERVPLAREAPPVAPGARAATAAAGSTAADTANGYFYAYEHAWFEGKWCAWDGTAKNWGNPGGAGTGGKWGCGGDYGFDNIATSVWNNGFYFPGADAVNMHVETFYLGGRMCLDRGDYWADFTLGLEVFNDGTAADNQISSHYWGTTCV